MLVCARTWYVTLLRYVATMLKDVFRSATIWENMMIATHSHSQVKSWFVPQGLSMIGVQQIDRVVEVVEETLKGT